MTTAMTWLDRHPKLFSAAVIIFWLAVDIGTLFFLEEPTIGPTLITAVFILSFWWRTSRPWIVFAMAAVTAVATHPIGPIAVIVALYSLASFTTDRVKSLAAVAGFVAIPMIMDGIYGHWSISRTPTDALVFGATWLVGDIARSRREHNEQLAERAERAEQFQRVLADHAVSAERTRIARELHDIVAHSMSIMVVQAGAARRVATKNPNAAQQALETIETVGRNSLDEMRRLLDVLRSPSPEAITLTAGAEVSEGSRNGAFVGSTLKNLDQLLPQPDLASLDSLLEEFENVGMRIDFETIGVAPELPRALELNAYRIIQEALTNVLKHSSDQRASLTLTFTDTCVAIKVLNNLSTAGTFDQNALNGKDQNRNRLPNLSRAGAQKGIIGMQERVALFQGELFVGIRGDMHLVEATLQIPS